MRLTASRSIATLGAGGLLVNVFFTSTSMYKELSFIGTHPQLSRDEKMRLKVGGWVLDLTAFVNDQSPPESVIMIPPQRTAPWDVTGHFEMISYYVYPRRVVHGPANHSETAIREYLRSHPEITHMIITSEGTLWPDIPPLPGDEVHLLKPGWGIAKVGR